jgi:hypothetical protein
VLRFIFRSRAARRPARGDAAQLSGGGGDASPHGACDGIVELHEVREEQRALARFE